MGFRCPFISSIHFIVTIFPNIVIIITENYMLQSIFFTVFLFAVCFSRQMPCWPGLLLEATPDKHFVRSYGIFSFRLSVLVPSRPMPYHPGLFCQAVSSGRLGSAVWNLLVQTSYFQKDPLDGAASFFCCSCYRSKICPGDEPGEQMASTEDPCKRKIICSWRELNPDRPVASPTFYL